jgi:uncharacterized membrane protein
MGLFRAHVSRHRRFYFSALLGILSWLVTGGLARAERYAVAGDTFFGVYLVMMSVLAFQTSPDDLRNEAETEDEGVALILAITIAVIAFSLTSIFALLNQNDKPDALRIGLSVASAPLGWFMLHTVAAFHYAHLYYSTGRSRRPNRSTKAGLKFPDTDEPGIWEFLYYSFVVGMTAQVSDIQIMSTPLRQLTLGHSVVSFFYNTVLIAVAVNVVVVLA